MGGSDSSLATRQLRSYVIGAACVGAIVVTLSLQDLLNQPANWQTQWLSLVALTVVSGLIPVTLPSVRISISISETFIIAGTLLFGVAGGTILVLLDALFISLRLFLSHRLRWEQLLFNLAAPPLSIWIAATVAGIEPLFATEPVFGASFIITLALFTTLYFLLNSWLITFALALEQGARPLDIWWRSFREFLVNYAAGGSIAALLVYNTQTVDPYFVAAIFPLLIVLFLTYQWSNKRVEAEREKNLELNRVFLSTIEALALAIDAKDQVTHGHIRRVQRYTMALAESLGLRDARQLDALRAAALLHDTGKLAVPEYILNKPGPLTASEFERMKVHAVVGADIIKSIKFPYPVEPIVRHHHERWDGKGYPDKIRGTDIPIGARILSVVDCYDALTSDRPYRPRYDREHAEQVLREQRGVMYDPWIVDAFLAILDRLEKGDTETADETGGHNHWTSSLAPKQLDAISATTAEDREFNELRRELPKATSLEHAGEILLRHLRRVIPAASVALFTLETETNKLTTVACSGVGSAVIQDLQIGMGERISGWALAHKQVVQNSNAILELGPIAKTFSVPLRYALAVPVIAASRTPECVVTFYAGDPFDNDHRRLLESAATLFAPSIGTLPTRESERAHQGEPETAGGRIH